MSFKCKCCGRPQRGAPIKRVIEVHDVIQNVGKGKEVTTTEILKEINICKECALDEATPADLSGQLGIPKTAKLEVGNLWLIDEMEANMEDE